MFLQSSSPGAVGGAANTLGGGCESPTPFAAAAAARVDRDFTLLPVYCRICCDNTVARSICIARRILETADDFA
jgi:hypothetical protein